jgi:hypothetical protein
VHEVDKSMIHEIKVPAGLDEKIVTITVDPESGKASIRVDGKMAGRPLAPDETRREVRVGDDRYELRREWDQFDLEYLGPAEQSAVAPTEKAVAQTPATPRKKPSFPVGKALAAVVVTLVVGWMYRPISDVIVDWNRFMAPDNTFWVEMPGEVVEAKLGSFAKTAGARAWVAERSGKIFEIGFLDVPRDVKGQWESQLINGIRDGIAKKYKGQVISDKDWPGGTELMIHCEEWRDTKDGPPVPRDVRLRLMIRGHRVVIAAVSAPPREIMSMTVTRFFLSVKV